MGDTRVKDEDDVLRVAVKFPQQVSVLGIERVDHAIAAGKDSLFAAAMA